MDIFASLFIGNPQNILIVTFVFLLTYLMLRFTRIGKPRHPCSLLIASSAWGIYAAWEWLVHTKTPEANIRIDLLVILPVLLIISAWALLRLFRYVRFDPYPKGYPIQFAQGGRLMFPDSAYTIYCVVQPVNFVTDIKVSSQ